LADLIPFPRPPKREDVRPPSRDELRAADRRRMLENLAAAVFVVALVLFGYWVIDRVSSYSRNVTCLSAKLKDCR
jgi:hypothetical protein